VRPAVLLLVPVVLAVASCTVGPDFHRPKTAVSASWQETGDPRVSTASATYRAWWKAFNDPVLDRLIERAYRENLSLRQAGVRVLQARAQLGVAVGEIFPQTQQAIGSVQYNRTSDRAVTAPAAKGSVEYWQSQVGAQASCEPPRVSRRLHSLRGWGHGNAKQVLAGGPGAGGKCFWA